MDIIVQESDFCEETNFVSPCPSPEEKDTLNIDFLTINGRFTPNSGRSSACSSRSVSLATTPVPPDDGDSEEDEVTINMHHRVCSKKNMFETTGRATPVFTWNPLPTPKTIVYTKDSDNQVKFSRVNLMGGYPINCELSVCFFSVDSSLRTIHRVRQVPMPAMPTKKEEERRIRLTFTRIAMSTFGYDPASKKSLILSRVK